MAEGQSPRLGLVTDNDLNRRLLQALLADAGYELVESLNSKSLAEYFQQHSEADISTRLDAWILDVDEGHIQEAMVELMDHSSLPLLLNDTVPDSLDEAAHAIWRRRLLEKLEVVAVPIAPVSTDDESPDGPWSQNVWLLAASLGGPEAVNRFLSALPAGLALSMIYGQHIQASFDRFLASALNKQPHYRPQLIRGQQRLCDGLVAVIPADRQVRFLPHGRMVETRQAWTGAYQPALDQVIAELARIYRQRLGVIVFSGMCDDGAIGCRVARACGATIWVQSPETCLSSAMPSAAIGTGCVTRQGSPEVLAAALAEHLTAAATNTTGF